MRNEEQRQRDRKHPSRVFCRVNSVRVGHGAELSHRT